MLLTAQRSAENDITLEALPTVEGAQVGVVLFRPGNKAIEGKLLSMYTALIYDTHDTRVHV
jgi:hypothetical protein